MISETNCSIVLVNDLNKNFSYLEIGSYEGLSALNILYNYPNSKVTTIDLWNQSNINSEYKIRTRDHFNYSEIQSVREFFSEVF